MATFMLLLRGGEFTKYTPEEMKQVVGDYFQWGEKLRRLGKSKGGDELKAGGRLLSTKDGRVIDGPFVETKEVVGGYALVEAKSYEEAMALATRFMDLHRIHWPKFEGECEVRPLEAM